MSYDIYYSVRESKKSFYFIEVMFSSKPKKIYDNKPIKDLKSYAECISYIKKNNIKDCYIRRELVTGGGIDFKQWRIKND